MIGKRGRQVSASPFSAYNKVRIYLPGALMKQLLGFVMFWIGVGILTTFFMPVQGWFVRALAAFSLMLVGYNLFSSDGKCGK